MLTASSSDRISAKAALRYASVSRSLLPFNRSLLPYGRSLLTLTHTSGMRECQKRPIYMAKEAYLQKFEEGKQKVEKYLRYA